MTMVYDNVESEKLEKIFPECFPCNCNEKRDRITYKVFVSSGIISKMGRGNLIQFITVKCNECLTFKRFFVGDRKLYEGDLTF